MATRPYTTQRRMVVWKLRALGWKVSAISDLYGWPKHIVWGDVRFIEENDGVVTAREVEVFERREEVGRLSRAGLSAQAIALRMPPHQGRSLRSAERLVVRDRTALRKAGERVDPGSKSVME